MSSRNWRSSLTPVSCKAKYRNCILILKLESLIHIFHSIQTVLISLLKVTLNYWILLSFPLTTHEIHKWSRRGRARSPSLAVCYVCLLRDLFSSFMFLLSCFSHWYRWILVFQFTQLKTCLMYLWTCRLFLAMEAIMVRGSIDGLCTAGNMIRSTLFLSFDPQTLEKTVKYSWHA